MGETDSKEAIKIISSTFNGPWGSEQMKSELKVRSGGRSRRLRSLHCCQCTEKSCRANTGGSERGQSSRPHPPLSISFRGTRALQTKTSQPTRIHMNLYRVDASSNHYRLTATTHFWSIVSLNGSRFLSGHFFSWNWSQQTSTHIWNYYQDFLLTYVLKWRAQMKSADHLVFSVSNFKNLRNSAENI